ncbi:MAG TPA: HAMP domain-containing sensor histidine kinase [Gaiellaceae bacterium]
MIGLGIGVAVASFAAALLAVVLLRRLPTLRLQLAGLALTAVCVPLAAVVLSGVAMYHMGHDVEIAEVVAAAAAAAVAAALLLGNSVVRRVDDLRRAATSLSGGELSARAPESGPAELRALATSFNEMAASLESLFDARRRLVAWASHDLRTPLAALQAMLEAIEDGLVEPDEYLPALSEQTAILARLVDDLFELARIDAGVLQLELSETRLDEVVGSCVRALRPQALARRVALDARVEEEARAARCSAPQVERVLLNLLTNALRHTPSDGSVAVVVEPAGSEVRVTVEDTGEGIEPGTERRMFERFWRGDGSRTRASGGAGLGLAIAQGLVEAQGGRIWAERTPAGGARVSFTLPAAT